MEIGIQNRRPRDVQPARADLDHQIPRFFAGREVLWVCDVLFRGVLPIVQEYRLLIVGGGALQPDVGIAPKAQGALVHIFIAHIVAACVADASVYDGILAVAPVVYVHHVRLAAGMEEVSCHALGAQLFEVPAAGRLTAKTVQQHTNLDTFFHFLEKQFPEFIAQFILLPNEILQVDVMLRSFNVFLESCKFVFAVEKQLGLVVVGRGQRLAGGDHVEQ